MKKSRKQRNIVKFRLVVFASLAGLLILFSLFSDKLCPMDPYLQDLSNAKAAPSFVHPLGTDRYGRDMLSRIIVGSKTSIFSTLLLVTFISVFGSMIGLICGWFENKIDVILMRIADMFLALSGTGFCPCSRSGFRRRSAKCHHSTGCDLLAKIRTSGAQPDLDTKKGNLYQGCPVSGR